MRWWKFSCTLRLFHSFYLCWGVFLYGFKGREVLTPELRAGSLYPKSKIRITRWCMVQAALLLIGVLALIEGKFDQNFGRVSYLA